MQADAGAGLLLFLTISYYLCRLTQAQASLAELGGREAELKAEVERQRLSHAKQVYTCPYECVPNLLLLHSSSELGGTQGGGGAAATVAREAGILELKASHTLVAEGLTHTSSSRPHTLVAEGLIH
jgi:hypothetical protein